MSGLHARDLSMTIDGRRIVGPLSLALEPGEVVGLLGPNGAGKSTLMRALAGLAESSGDVTIAGAALAGLSPRQRARQIAFLPQERTIGWPIEVERLVDLGRLPWRAYGAAADPRDRALCERAMRLMDVTALSGRKATALSGGEQARALAARAIAQDTPFLIADEPASGLDPAHQIATMAAFREIAAEGRGILVSLHDLTLAAGWCTRVIVLRDGAIAAEGRPENVLTAPLLADVYGIEAHIVQAGGRMVVSPMALVPGRRA